MVLRLAWIDNQTTRRRRRCEQASTHAQKVVAIMVISNPGVFTVHAHNHRANTQSKLTTTTTIIIIIVVVISKRPICPRPSLRKHRIRQSQPNNPASNASPTLSSVSCHTEHKHAYVCTSLHTSSLPTYLPYLPIVPYHTIPYYIQPKHSARSTCIFPPPPTSSPLHDATTTPTPEPPGRRAGGSGESRGTVG